MLWILLHICNNTAICVQQPLRSYSSKGHHSVARHSLLFSPSIFIRNANCMPLLQRPRSTRSSFTSILFISLTQEFTSTINHSYFFNHSSLFFSFLFFFFSSFTSILFISLTQELTSTLTHSSFFLVNSGILYLLLYSHPPTT